MIFLSFLAGLLSNFRLLMLSVSDGRHFPTPLSAKEERLYFEAAAAGDSAAREKLIEHNLRLVAHIVRKYYASQKNQEDLVSIGTIGLIKAIDSFNIKNGARFATYAAKCIQNEILMHFRVQKKLSCEVSLNETIDIDREGNPLTYGDIISIDDTIADDLDVRIKIAKAIGYIKNSLNDREREILILRYGLGQLPPVTQREAAEQLGISRSYVSRIEKSALEKINLYLNGS